MKSPAVTPGGSGRPNSRASSARRLIQTRIAWVATRASGWRIIRIDRGPVPSTVNRTVPVYSTFSPRTSAPGGWRRSVRSR